MENRLLLFNNTYGLLRNHYTIASKERSSKHKHITGIVECHACRVPIPYSGGGWVVCCCIALLNGDEGVDGIARTNGASEWMNKNKKDSSTNPWYEDEWALKWGREYTQPAANNRCQFKVKLLLLLDTRQRGWLGCPGWKLTYSDEMNDSYFQFGANKSQLGNIILIFLFILETVIIKVWYSKHVPISTAIHTYERMNERTRDRQRPTPTIRATRNPTVQWKNNTIASSYINNN